MGGKIPRMDSQRDDFSIQIEALSRHAVNGP